MGDASTDLRLDRLYGQSRRVKRHGEGVGQRGLGDHVAQLHSQMNDGLGNLRTNAANDAVGSHETRRRDRLQQVLRYQRIDERNTGDIDDGDVRTGIDNLLQETFHDDLCPLAIQRPDQRKRQDSMPQFHHRSRKLQHVLLLARNDGFARFLIGLNRPQSQFVQQESRRPNLVSEAVCVLSKLLSQALK